MEQMIAAASTAPIDVDMNNFMAEVIEGSSQQPVIVQFWAPWCGPCKQLGPILEKVVGAAGNKVKMVRVNIDDNAQIAQQLRVQSVPTVYGFVDGQPVDGFTGVQPESDVTAFVEKISSMGGQGASTAALIEEATTAIAAQDFTLAMTKFQEVMTIEPESVEALAGVIRCLTGMGDIEGAREVVDQLNDEYADNPAMKPAIAAVELAEKAAGASGDLAGAQAAIEADENDLEARQNLALALFASGQHVEAMDQLLISIKIDMTWNEGAARQQLLDFFASLGGGNADVMTARRKLSTMLFS